MTQLALIDSDILVYRIGFTTENEPEEVARWRLEESMHQILDALETDSFRCYLTSEDKSNFRYELFPAYKAHRKDKPKPRHYQYLRTVITDKLGGIVVHGQEADDQLGIDQTDDTVIVTIDKDLDQVPGWHYNFVKLIKYNISPLEATRQFYSQCLIGDKSTDNIEGCPGIGPVKANRMLEGCETEQEMLEAVVKSYRGAYDEKSWSAKLMLAGSLLWIRKQPDQKWTLTTGEVVSNDVLENCWTNLE